MSSRTGCCTGSATPPSAKTTPAPQRLRPSPATAPPCRRSPSRATSPSAARPPPATPRSPLRCG